MAAINKASNSGMRAKGKLKEVAGKATGNEHLRVEGKDDQSMAELRQAAEKVKDALSQ